MLVKWLRSTSEITHLVSRQIQGIKGSLLQAGAVAAISEETSAGTERSRSRLAITMEMIASVRNLTIHLKKQAEELKSTITKFKL